MELPQEARDSWLESLDQLDIGLKGDLRALLERHALIDTSDFLGTLPKFRPAGNAAIEATEPDGLVAGTLVGSYVIEQEVGRGGMGVVWRARRADGLVKRPVALKLLRAGLFSKELLARFARERDILGALEHPNIARLYDAGLTAAGQPFLALQYVEGKPISEYCEAHCLSIDGRVSLFRQVLVAVQYAHSHLVIHRDLKPSNMLVTGAGQVQLLDFGIAKLLLPEGTSAPPLTEFGSRALTLDYAAPEQISGGTITTATDVYSLGVVLYELLAGRRPYRLTRDSRGALEDAILSAEPRRPSEVVSDEKLPARSGAGAPARQRARMLRGDLDTIVLKALKKSPSDRYSTVDAFAADIDNHLAGRPVHARPDTVFYRARKFLGRNAPLAASMGAVLVALATGLAIALWQADKAREHAHRAETQAQIATAVQTFMLNLFHANSIEQPDPIKAQQTTARELLDLGAKQIEHDLKDAPEVRLRALKMLADTYTELRMTEKAVALNHERVVVAKSLYGADGAEVAYALIDLSDNLQTAKAVSERASVLREATRILDLRNENGSNARGRLLRQLAQLSIDKEPARSLEYSDQAIALYRERHEPLEVVRSLMAKGFIQYRLDNPQGGIVALSEAAEECDALQSLCAGEVPKLYSYLGDVRQELGEIPAAESALRRAFASALAREGPDHPDTIQTEVRLGQLLFDTARTSEGLQTLRSALDRAIRAKGADESFHVPFVREVYGYRLMQVGMLEEGLTATHQAISIYRKYRPTNASLAAWLDIEMYGLDSLARLREADAHLTEAAALLSPLAPTDPMRRDHARYGVEHLIAVGRSAEAAELAAQAGFRSTLKPGLLTRLDLREVLLVAECARANGDAQYAVAIARGVREAIQADSARQYFSVYEAKAALIEGKALLTLRRASEALPLAQAAVTGFSSLYDREHSPVLSDAQITLANCYLTLGQLAQARSLLASAAAIQASHRALAAQYTAPLRNLRARMARVGRPIN
jgi:serine/threonine-protein kinase